MKKKHYEDFGMEFTSQPVNCSSATIGAKKLDATSNEIKRAPCIDYRHSGFRRSGFRRSGLDIGGLDFRG